MKFSILSLFPQMIENACSYSILERAKNSGLIEIETINPRDYTKNKHKKVDDTPYGGGCGMVLSPQPFIDAYKSVQKLENSTTILLSPQGQPLKQNIIKDLAKNDQIIMLCGHYEGFDERIKKIINPIEISIGDYVLTGGELPALCIIDAVSRFIDGTLHSKASSEFDSFSDGLLEYPQYTKPQNFEGFKVPDVLLNGNHAQINEYRHIQQLLITKQTSPDLYEKFKNSAISDYEMQIITMIEQI